MFIVQAVSAAVQIVASLIIGEVAQKVGSIKWCLVGLFLLSFAGNFIYSCASTISLSTILGGRILCGVASSSGALVFSYITATHKEKLEVFKYVSVYRTAAGLFMAISQVVAILASYCDFSINNFRVHANNAPTFVCSFIMLSMTAALVYLLANPDVPQKKAQVSFFKALKTFFNVKWSQLVGSLILMWGMFLASFLMSEVVYFMPVFLTQSLKWDIKYQAVAFLIASIIGVVGSVISPTLVELPIKRREKEFKALEEKHDLESSFMEAKADYETYKKKALHHNQVSLTLVSLCNALVGQAFMVGAGACFQAARLGHRNIGCFFTGGVTLVLLGYNCMASSFPAMFTAYIDPSLKVQLMPLIGTIAALGKLVAPIVLSALNDTKYHVQIAVGCGMILTFLTVPFVLFLYKQR